MGGETLGRVAEEGRERRGKKAEEGLILTFKKNFFCSSFLLPFSHFPNPKNDEVRGKGMIPEMEM